MNKASFLFSFLLVMFCSSAQLNAQNLPKINLSGEWRFKTDPQNKGIKENWFLKKLDEKVQLPGSMTTNGKGDDISLNTPWIGSIVDSSYFVKPEYAKYRVAGNIKVPFWLQPLKYYKGAAWYQKQVTIPASWQHKPVELFIERSHWETMVWLDGKEIGLQNSLGTPHTFNLNTLTPGVHTLTVRIDNQIKDFNVGINSHSISDHTQSNWNGMIGELSLSAHSNVRIVDIQIYPDVKNKQVLSKILVENNSGKPIRTSIELLAVSPAKASEKLNPVINNLLLKNGTNEIELAYPMGNKPLLWDEFEPNMYTMKASLKGKAAEAKQIKFGMREFGVQGKQFTVNGRKIFLRGTLECAIFPKTGYPPTDEKEWLRIFSICKSYGLNHVRFHSWCPPEAAFNAADRLGLYLQIECSSWANQGTTIGSGLGLDDYIYKESKRVVKAFGNHPSFCLMTYGNEPGGPNHKKFLIDFVKYWKAKDKRRLYTSAAGWPVISESDYNNTPAPRIQAWKQGLKSIINSKAPSSDYDWSEIIAKWEQPTVSHEIGQWCVYPDFKEIKKYDGVLKAKNFEIFQDRLNENGLGALADSFLLASGKLQVLCYKADIEAALRTPNFAGFQLLDLHDFPGQGTALVGVLNPFWEEKGYVTSKEYSRFCNTTVPLVRLSKMIYLNNETLSVPVEIAHFGKVPLLNNTPEWTIKNDKGETLFSGKLTNTTIPVGNSYQLGKITQELSAVQQASRLILSVSVGDFSNSWDLFVYPASLPASTADVFVTQQLDAKAMQVLDNGGSVLLSVKKGSIKSEYGGDIPVGFSSIFWNTAWTIGQAPHTLGILCDPKHPALKQFPTQYHSNYQWWDAMSHSDAITLNALSPKLKPIVRVIDDWFTARSLGLVFECKVGKGKLLFSSIDLLTDTDKRYEARQLLHSFNDYVASKQFNPEVAVAPQQIAKLFKSNP